MAPAVLESRRSARGLLIVLAAGIALLTFAGCDNPATQPVERNVPDEDPEFSLGPPPLSDRASPRLSEDEDPPVPIPRRHAPLGGASGDATSGKMLLYHGGHMPARYLARTYPSHDRPAEGRGSAFSFSSEMPQVVAMTYCVL